MGDVAGAPLPWTKGAWSLPQKASRLRGGCFRLLFFRDAQGWAAYTDGDAMVLQAV